MQVTGESLPEIKHVAGSNNCAIGYVLDRRAGRLIVVSVLDNLIKGAAGQAGEVQGGAPRGNGLHEFVIGRRRQVANSLEWHA